MIAKPGFRHHILQASLGFCGVFLFAVHVSAGVSSFYKWTDEQGKVHFTDDPLKIPEPHRAGPSLEKFRGIPAPKASVTDAPASATEETTGPDSPVEKNKEDAKPAPDAGKSKEEKAVMQEALSFLKSDIVRYKKYDEYIPQQRHAILLRNEVVEALPAKEALVKKLEKFRSPVLQEAGSFLKQSLLKDYEIQAREHPKRLIFIGERSRLQSELPAKNQLVAKLQAELESAAKTPAGPPASQDVPEGNGEGETPGRTTSGY